MSYVRDGKYELGIPQKLDSMDYHDMFASIGNI